MIFLKKILTAAVGIVIALPLVSCETKRSGTGSSTTEKETTSTVNEILGDAVMKDYVKILSFDDSISVAFYIENDNIMSIGEKLEAINENAYMNGYNWEALLNCYIANYAPDLSDTYDTDSEAGMYSAIFENNADGKAAAQAMAEIIISLIENENKLYDFVREYGEEIEWD